MSDVQAIPTSTEAIVSQPVATADPSVIPENLAKDETDASADAAAIQSKEDEITPNGHPKEETTSPDVKDDSTPPEKVIEPITEGQLTYKAPGLLKSLIPSKKEVWLTEETTSSEELSSYTRGEKPEIANPVVAWASQTGKGLLFLNKKGDINRKQPGHILPLYDATDLKKPSATEITLKLAGQEHTLKAATEAERDGWYMSIEKAVELGSSAKNEIHESEGYKEELEKLNKPNVTAITAAAASKRSRSRPKKSTDVERSDSEAPVEDKTKVKSRSTSRGVLSRFRSAKEESELKKEEPEVNGEEAKSEEGKKTDEIAAAAAGTAIAGAGGVVAVETTGTSEESTKEATESPIEASKTEDKTKPAKRGSIFGRMSGWGGVKSPSKEKEVELKPETPAKDDVVSEDPPVLPETATTEPTDTEAEANKIESKAETEVIKEDEAKKDEVASPVITPGKEKSSFLSGLLPKRNRSVSPSANLTTKTDTEAPKETVEEPVKVEEPATEMVTADYSKDAEEAAKVETSTPNKRQSVLGSLGRRASKAMSGMRGQKKENVVPTTETTTVESTEAAPTADNTLIAADIRPTSSEQQTIGDVVPSAVITESEQPRAVTASA